MGVFRVYLFSRDHELFVHHRFRDWSMCKGACGCVILGLVYVTWHSDRSFPGCGVIL